MAKRVADKWDDTVRPGSELGYQQEVDNGNPFGVFIRVFESERMAMSPWAPAGDMTTDETAAKELFADQASACKSGSVMCAALVRVKDVYEPGKLSINPEKWWCNGVCLDCRASHLLHGGQQAAKNQVPDGYQLAEALRAEFHLYMTSTDQTGDDAAKDKGHDTATGTPDPNPDNIPVAPMEGDPTAVQGDGRIGTALSEDGQTLVPVDEPENGQTRGRGKRKGKVANP